MPGVTLDKMKEGYSKIRNRALAHAFSYMNLIEAWGSGIPKLMEAMREYGLREPEFRDMEIGFRINLYRNTEDALADTTQDAENTTQDAGNTTQDAGNTTQAAENATQVTKDTTQVRLTEEDKAILAAIKKQHNITQKEMAAKLGWKVDRVKYYLNKMKRRNFVKRVGTSQKGYWEILIEDNMWQN